MFSELSSLLVDPEEDTASSETSEVSGTEWSRNDILRGERLAKLKNRELVMKRNLEILKELVKKHEKLLKEMDDNARQQNNPAEKRYKLKNRVFEYGQDVAFLENEISKLETEIASLSKKIEAKALARSSISK